MKGNLLPACWKCTVYFLSGKALPAFSLGRPVLIHIFQNSSQYQTSRQEIRVLNYLSLPMKTIQSHEIPGACVRVWAQCPAQWYDYVRVLITKSDLVDSHLRYKTLTLFNFIFWLLFLLLTGHLLQGKWDVPLPKVRAVGEDEVFRVVRTGKTRSELLLEK